MHVYACVLVQHVFQQSFDYVGNLEALEMYVSNMILPDLEG